MLSRYVPKLYAYASTSLTIDKNCSNKLDKLVGVWEAYKYFDDNCYKVIFNVIIEVNFYVLQVFFNFFP